MGFEREEERFGVGVGGGGGERPWEMVRFEKKKKRKIRFDCVW